VTLLDRPFEPEAAAAPRYATEPEGLRRFVQAVPFALATGTNPPTELSADDGWLARIPVADHDVLAALWSASRDPLEVISELQTAFSREMSGLDELNAPARMRQHFYSLVLGAFAWPFAWGALQGVIEALQDEELPARPSPLAAMVLGVLLPVSSAVLARGGIGIGLSGAELRTVDGAPADYGRALARSLPLAACTGAASYASAAGHRWEAVALVAAIGALAVVQAAVSPARGPGDYLARTFIRPR
jgi:hypothetical protein